jgi:toxin ParE1/3/4
MARVIFSPRAKRDIVEALAYTQERWSAVQARAYGEIIREALNAIAQDPRRGKSRDDVRPGVLAYHIGQCGSRARHVVFYRVRADGVVEVIRLLHDAMDFERHLG